MALAERFALFVTMRTNEALGPLRALQITGASSVILEQFLEVPKGLWEWQVFPLKYVSMRGHRLIPRPESYSVLFRNDAGSGAPAAIKGRIGVAASPARRAFNRRYTQPLMPGFYTRWLSPGPKEPPHWLQKVFWNLAMVQPSLFALANFASAQRLSAFMWESYSACVMRPFISALSAALLNRLPNPAQVAGGHGSPRSQTIVNRPDGRKDPIYGQRAKQRPGGEGEAVRQAD
jgi:hypothetical protein